MTKTDHLLSWFLAHLDEVPVRLHRRGVWTDPEDGAGSALGSPALDRRWERWLEAAYGRAIVTETVPCFHAGRPEGRICEVCAIRDADGRAIAESGLRHSEREIYRWPMRAAIADLGLVVTPPGRPSLSVTLLTLARSGGDIASAAEVLARRWPGMSDPKMALGHISFALHQLRKRWPKYDPSPIRAEWAVGE